MKCCQDEGFKMLDRRECYMQLRFIYIDHPGHAQNTVELMVHSDGAVQTRISADPSSKYSQVMNLTLQSFK